LGAFTKLSDYCTKLSPVIPDWRLWSFQHRKIQIVPSLMGSLSRQYDHLKVPSVGISLVLSMGTASSSRILRIPGAVLMRCRGRHCRDF
jgi:hypothetical protein